jgi:hypothetical protein
VKFDFKIFLALFWALGCQKSDQSSDEGSAYEHPSKPGAVTSVQSAPTKSIAVAVSLTEDTVISLGTTTVTIPVGAVTVDATASLSSYGGVFINSNAVNLQSEPVLLRIFDMGGVDLLRSSIHRDLRVDVESAGPVVPQRLALLFHENGGELDALKSGVSMPSVSKRLEAIDGGRYKASFVTRTPRLAVTMADSGGGLPVGFSEFVWPAIEVTGLKAKAISPTAIKLEWTSDAALNGGFALAYSPDGAVLPPCTLDRVVEPSFDESTSTFSTQISSLVDHRTYKFRVCSTSKRNPPDLSQGLVTTAATPARALATLGNAPSGRSNVTSLDVTVGGTNVAQYKYALLSNATNCSTASYSDWINVTSKIIDPVAVDGSMLLCVLGRKDETNLQLIPTTASWVIDRTPPTFQSVALINTATDGSVNVQEKSNVDPIIGNLNAVGYDGVRYATVNTSVDCNGTLAYTPQVPSSQTLPQTPTNAIYKVCLQLFDVAGNVTYAQSPPVTLDLVPPVFTDLPLVHEASDGYINFAEHASGNELIGSSVGSGFSLEEYVVTTSTAHCSDAGSYVTTKPLTSAIQQDGSYKVCAKLADAAGNLTFGSSGVLIRKTTLPSFAALSLGDDVADTYLSMADVTNARPLAKNLVASHHSRIEYAVVEASIACDVVNTYGLMPTGDSSIIQANDTEYKVCVKLSDQVGNPPAFGASEGFFALISPPTCSAMSRAGDALDGYINSLEHQNVTSIVGSVSNQSSTVETLAYAVMQDGLSCDGSLIFGSDEPKSNHVTFSTVGSYRLCARVSDAEGQHGYCSSELIKAANVTIGFTSIDRTAVVSDGYLNQVETTTNEDLVSNLVGSNFDVVRYALTTDNDCRESLNYEIAIPGTQHLSLDLDGSTYRVCVELSDLAGNPKAYGTSATFVLDKQPPSVDSLDLANAASDGFVNQVEKAASEDLVRVIVVEPMTTISYALSGEQLACNAGQQWSTAVPKTNDPSLGSDGTYKVCVRLVDLAGNATITSSAAFALDTIQPEFTSLALANDASDQFINLVETGHEVPVVGTLLASGYNQVSYMVLPSQALCTGANTYTNAMPTALSFGGLNGDYKICIKLSDDAGNLTLGSSAIIHVDTVIPSFTSLALGSDVLDLALSIQDKTLSHDLAGELVASGFDRAEYVVVEASLDCSQQTVFGIMPKTNAATVDTHGNQYKVCVRLSDDAGNPSAYGSTATFVALLSPPTCADVALDNDASDGYLNTVEHLNASPVVGAINGEGPTVTGRSYAVIASTAACDSSQSFVATQPGSDHGMFSVSGAYKVCARVGDGASQYGYCTSPQITSVMATISFTAIDRTAVVADGYLNPAEKQAASALVTNLVGTNFDTARYAVVPSATTCHSLVSYGNSVPKSDDAAITLDGGSYRVCVELSDVAGNPKAYGTSATFIYDGSSPSFTAMPLANAAGDGYINLSEHSLTSELAGPLQASGYAAVNYALVASTVTCGQSLSWVSGIAKANDSVFVANTGYKLCVQLTDLAGNVTYGSSPEIIYDDVIPVFTGIDLVHGAADGYINAGEASGSDGVVDQLSASGHDEVQYVVALQSAGCSSQTGYAGSVPSGGVFAGLNGEYKVCVSLSDTAGNRVFGASALVRVDTRAPEFTSLALGSDVADQYLSMSDAQQATPIAQSLVASHYDGASYALVGGGAVCDGSLSYGVMPLGTASGISVNGGSYKTCVKLTDAAGNSPAYGSSPTFVALITSPTCSGVPLSGDAADGYINSTEHQNSTPMIGSIAGASSTVTGRSYAVIASTAACDSSQSFVATQPGSDHGMFSVSGAYKVCARVGDGASQYGYCTSPQITSVMATISFTAIDRTAVVADGYLNPAEKQAASALVTNLVGTNFDTARYAVVPSATTCHSLVSYGNSVPKSDDAAITLDGGSYRVCVELSDVAGNPKAYGTSATFIYDGSSPSFTAMPLANAAGDGYINLLEHAAMSDIAGPINGSDFTDVQYALVRDATVCALPIAWISQIPRANDGFLSDVGLYKICVKLSDTAGNITLANTASFEFDNVPPVFSSISRVNASADGYINSVETADATDVVGQLIAAGFNSTAYIKVQLSLNCTTQTGYQEAVPKANEFSGLSGGYKVCVKLADSAGNIALGSSDAMVVDTVVPQFVSMSLTGDAADGFINAAERVLANNLTTGALFTGHDSIAYTIASEFTPCSSLNTWGSMIPMSNSDQFNGNGRYKVCARGSDSAGNPAAYGASQAFTLDDASPIFTSLALAGPAVDGYLNQLERAQNLSIRGALTATGFQAASYKLVSVAQSCTNALIYDQNILSDTGDISEDGSYKICVRLVDSAENVTFGSSSDLIVDTVAPVFSSLALGPTVLDGFLNILDRTAASSLGGLLTASGNTTNAYALIQSSFQCDSNAAFGGMPNTDHESLVDGLTYRVCAKIADPAGNESYGASATFTVDLTAPLISAVTLHARLTDGFLSSFDTSPSVDLVTSVSALGQGALGYAVAAQTAMCNGALSYDTMRPKTDAITFTSDGMWKICVRATDLASNPPAYFASSVFTRDTEAPVSSVTTTGVLGLESSPGAETLIVGSASDSTSGLTTVSISIREGSGFCYDPAGRDFTASCPQWIPVSGASTWSRSFEDSEFMRGVTYTVQSRAADLAGHVQSNLGSGTFTWSVSEGSNLWNRDMTYDYGSGDDRPLAGAIDSRGDLYVVGYHTVGDKNWLIKKFSRRGFEDVVRWNKDIGDQGVDEVARAIAIDNNDNIYVCGSRWNGSNWDWQVKKFNSSGVEDFTEWDIHIDSGNGDDEPMAIATDANNNVYVVGYGRNLVGPSSGDDIWLKKFTPNGQLACERKFDEGGVNLADRGNAIAINTATQKLYLAGYKTTLGSDRQLVVKRLRLSDCSVELGVTGNSLGLADSASSIRLDSSGNVFVAGVTSVVDQDWWIQKYSPSLVLQSSFDTLISGSHEPNSIAVTSDGYVYVGGYKQGTSDDLWLRQFNNALVENTTQWNLVLDGSSSGDRITAVVVSGGASDVNNVYMIGYGSNLVGPTSQGDWWVRKFSGR